MKQRITKRSVDSLRAPATGETVLWDSEISGFGVRTRSGGTKTYVLRYRPDGGGRAARLLTYTIGRHGSPWTPDGARSEAQRLLALVRQGDNPASERKEDRNAETVNQLAARFLASHVDAHCKPSTASEYRRLIDKAILPFMGSRKAKSITSEDVSKLQHAYRRTPYQANRIIAVLSKMFNVAEIWKIREQNTNPCQLVTKFKEQKRGRLLAADELTRLGEALTTSDAELPYAVAAIRLLLFTGARRSEIVGLRWAWIDIDRAEANLPDSKTGAKTIHLPPPALEVLTNLPRVDGNPYVIVGRKEGCSMVNIEKAWRRIRRLAGLSTLRLHDLRHACAADGVASGHGLPIIGKMVGQNTQATKKR